jgi:hypothetical protein
MQQKESGSNDYDIIHMDAFTGDGIPTHLLTREAMEIYLRRLAENGVILFHVSNRYYELRPMIKATSAGLNLYGAINIPATKDELKYYQNASWCVVLARNPARLQPLVDRGWVRLGKDDGLGGSAPWTDDYINILVPLIENVKWHMARYGTKIFDPHTRPRRLTLCNHLTILKTPPPSGTSKRFLFKCQTL